MIICGDALTELRKLPNESVNMCCTSPPYWGLRAYGTVPKLWGGDDGCLHEWTVHKQGAKGGHNLADNMPNTGGNTTQQLNPGSPRFGVESNFCSKCGGWRGELGLEPTPELYVQHLVEVFREVRRVLRSDGTCWLNLGDSYANDGKWGGTTGGKHAAGLHGEQVGRGRRDTGLKPKDLVGIPWRVAFALQADGWWLRQDIIWFKKNPMPESMRDRCTKAHEYLFMLAKNGKTILWQAKDTLEWSHKPDLSEILGHNEKGKPIKRWLGFSYYYDAEAVKEPAIYREDERPFGSAGGNRHGDEGKIYKPLYKDARSYSGKHSDKQRGHGRRHAGFNERWDAMSKEEQCGSMRNLRSVWAIATRPYAETHFATFPPEIPERCIKAGCPKGGTVLDPFFGAGTTGLVAMRLGREFIGIELNPAYCEMARKRIYGTLHSESAKEAS